LQNRRLVVRDETSGACQYLIAHAEMRKALYGALEAEERRSLHRAIGRLLQQTSEGHADELVEDLAYHFIGAEDREASLRYGSAAARKLKERYANTSAIEFYKAALSSLPEAPAPGLDAARNPELFEELADIYTLVADYEKAMPCYQSALKLSAGEAGDERIARIYRKLAAVCESKTSYDEALEYLHEGRRRLLVNGESLELARILEGIGRVLTGRRDLDVALGFYLDSLDALASHEMSQEAASVYNSLGTAYEHKRDFERAELYYQKSMQIRTALGDTPELSRSLNNLGNVAMLKRDFGLAANYYQRSLDIKKKVGFIHGVSVSEGNLGLLFQRQDNLDGAIEHLREAVRIRERVNDILGVARICYNLGHVSLLKGLYGDAMRYFRRCFDIAEKHSHSTRSYALIGLAEASAEVGALDEAEALAGEAVQLSGTAQKTLNEAWRHVLVGGIRMQQSRWEDAESEFLQGLEMLRNEGEITDVCHCLIQLAEVRLARRDLAHALEDANQAQNLARQAQRKTLLADAMRVRALLAMTKGARERENSLSLLSEARAIARSAGVLDLISRTNYALGECYRAEGKLKYALFYYDQCLQAFEVVCANLPDAKLRQSYLSSGDRGEVFKAIDALKRAL